MGKHTEKSEKRLEDAVKESGRYSTNLIATTNVGKNGMRYIVRKDGEWVQPRMKNFYLSCCGCKLAHRINFRLVPYGKNKRKIQFQAFRCKKTTTIRKKGKR